MVLPIPEEQLVRRFFLRERQERFLEGLANPRKRRKITGEFCHFKSLDWKHAVPIPPAQHTPQGIYSLLKQFGAPDQCWVLSDDSTIDARTLDLKEALDEIVGRTLATFLCCIDGKLVYFENEEGRWILRRP
jgi:hypothetical protein